MRPLTSTIAVSIRHVYAKRHYIDYVILMLGPSQKAVRGWNYYPSFVDQKADVWLLRTRADTDRTGNGTSSLQWQPWSFAPNAQALGSFISLLSLSNP